MDIQYKVFRYRWIILATSMPMIICSEIYWLALSPISSLAGQYYHVSSLGISMFAASYMIMYIIFTLPASWVIDKFGYRRSLITGALITSVFGVLQAVFATDFTAALIFQFAIAAGQPFLVNISTKVPANWFPVTERSTASGLLTLAQYLGFVVPMVLSPIIAVKSGVPTIYALYAAITCVCAAAAIVFSREKPRTPPGPEADKEDISAASLTKLFKNRNFSFVLLIAFISMGVFNALLTLIESMLSPRGITSDQAGIVGALFVIAGIIGAVMLPLISDRLHRRTPFFIIAISMLVPLYLGMTFLTNFTLLAMISAAAGFTIMGVAPILFQHGAEVAYPVREGTSFGLILFMGQVSGALFVFIFEALSGRTGSVIVPMLLFVVLTLIQVPFTFRMKESDIIKGLK